MSSKLDAMAHDFSRLSSHACPRCSRGPGAGHHDECPRHPLAVAKLVERERYEAARKYVANNRHRPRSLDLMREAFRAGAEWTAANAIDRADHGRKP
jgi:hypothetical protein